MVNGLCNKRIMIVGTCGSGKTTLAKNLAEKLKIPFIEMDELYWQPKWVMVSPEVFRQKVPESLQDENWIVDGNYSVVRDLFLLQATCFIWLDFPFYLIFWRLLKRSIKRISRKESICNGNYETVGRTFFSRDSIFLWAVKSHPRRKRQLNAMIKDPACKHLEIIRLRSPQAVRRYLTAVK